MQVINLTLLMSIMYIFFLLWLGDFLGSKLTPPNDRNDKLPFIRRRGEVVKKLEGQSGKILLNSF